VKNCGNIYPVLRGRIFFVGILLALLGPFPILSEAQRLEIRPASTGPVETDPGKVVTVSFVVNNPTRQTQRIDGQAFLPRGWYALMRRTSLDLPAQQSDIILVSFSIPLETSTGSYSIRYTVRSQTDPSLYGETSLSITILSMKSIELRLTDAPRFVIAGDRFIAQFSLVNKGNDVSTIRLMTRQVGLDTVFIDSTLIHVKPNEIRVLKTYAPTNQAANKKMQTLIELYATIITDTTVVVHASASSDVIPRLEYVDVNMYRYPVTVILRMAGSEISYRPQFELASSAPLSSGGKHNLELLVRTPETLSRSDLGSRDEYRAAYRSEPFDLFAGDRSYSLSTLTEYGRYSTGAGGRLTVSGLTLGGFYNNNRFLPQRQEEVAGFIDYDPLRNISIMMYYLQKREDIRSNMYSVRTLLQPITNTDIDLEYGHGWNPQGTDDAYYGHINGHASWYMYDFRYLHAGPSYPGYYRDLNSTSLNLSLNPLKNLRIEGYLHDDRRNLNLDTTQYIAPRDRSYQVSIGYSDLLAVYFRKTLREDELPVPQYRQAEDLYQIQSGFNSSWLSLYGSADLGRTQDRLLGKSAPFTRYYATLNKRIFGSVVIGVTGEYDNETNISTDEKQKRISGNVNLIAEIGEKTRCALNVYGSRSYSTFTQTYYMADLTIEQKFSWGHIISFHGRQIGTSPESEGIRYAFIADYAVPILIPLGRIGSVGNIAGRVVDIETQKGIPKVLLFISDATALTDDDGNFRFPGFPPGMYYVQIDKTSIGFDRVTTKPLPLEINLQGGGEIQLEIGIVRSCVVRGTVMLYGFSENIKPDSVPPQVLELHGQPDIYVQLSTENETLRRITDISGKFNFIDLHPGRWKLTVLEGQLPENHILEKESFDFDLKPGDQKSVEIKILPRRRAIRILQEGNVIEAKPIKPGPKIKPPQKIRPSRPQQISPIPATSLISYNKRRGGYVVQASSWRSRRRALAGIREAKLLIGKHAFLGRVRVPGIGLRYRVYVGPIKTRAEAEAIEKTILSKK